jgi:pimeloyl-ACP methyl ester carboxylesterase
MAFYDAGDAAIYYEVTGNGAPVVLLHGYALNSTMWEFQKPVLSSQYKVITVDLRGFGQSSCSGRWSSDIMAEDVADIITELKLRDCVIVGFSMSGPVAFKMVLNNADKISKLVLVSSILPSAGRAPKNIQTEEDNRELEALILHGPEAWAEAMGLRDGPLIGNTFRRNPAAKAVWEAMLARHNADYLRCMMEARRQWPVPIDWRAKLPRIACPTLIIAGAQDARFIDASKLMARVIPDARLEIVSGAGHMVNLERPDEFNRVLMDFLEDES